MKNILIAISVLIGSVVVNAQTLPSRVEVFMPQILQEQTISTSDVDILLNDASWGQKVAVKNKRYWVAYSDRSDNNAYASPSTTSAVKTKLDFNQKVRIAQIKSGFALVYDDNLNEYPNISRFAKVLGWVPMSKLLLWNSCPTNDLGIYYKALIAANISDETKNKQIKPYELYKDPDAAPSERIAPSMDFYFIMKTREDGKVLISRECRMDGATSQVLVGWVGSSTYVPWNQRSCIEPNWSPDDVKQFVSGKSTVNISYDSLLNNDILTYDFGKKNNSGTTEFDKYRMSQHVLRYPILDYKSSDDNVYKCNAFGTITGAMNEAILLKDKIEKARESAVGKVRNMNLMICIDGTKSMEPYFPAVKSAIAEAIKYIPVDQKLKVGLVIYRDYSDGQGLVEYLPLISPTDPRITKFLDNGGQYGIKSSAADRTHVEALYKGIELAIDPQKMGFKKEHSNFLLVVGDCGNDENDRRCLKSTEILNRMIDNNVQLMSFQVFRKNDYAWSLFNDQMSSLIQQNVQKRYQKLGTGVKVAYDELTDGYELNSKNSEQMYLGSIRYGRLNEAMPAQKLTDLIVENVNRFVKYIDNTTDIINRFDGISVDLINTTAGEESVAAKTNSARLKELIGAENYELFNKINAIFSYIGYTPKADMQKRDYWKPVIFISSEEFGLLVEKLQPVNMAAQHSSNDRKPYVEAMKALLRSMLPDISKDEMNAKGTQEIMNLITGLNVATNAAKGPTLMQIQDPKSVSHQQYLSIINEFARKYRALQRIKSKEYNFVFVSNNIKYYWIPVEDLP